MKMIPCNLGSEKIHCTWKYDPATPSFVTFRFGTEEVAEWDISRELLADALRGNEPLVEGDVLAWVEVDEFVISLKGPEGHVRLKFPLEQMGLLIVGTYEVVSTEAEWVINAERLEMVLRNLV